MTRHAVGALILLAACTPDSEINRLKIAPEVAITNPAPLEVIHRDGAYLFTGTAVDEWDPPEAVAIQWALDQGTPVSAPSPDAEGNVEWSLDLTGLDLGEHLVELIATDSDGEEGRVGVIWQLAGPLSAPTVTITAPNDGDLFPPGEEIAFRGEAVDEATPADQLVFVWASSVDGTLPGALSGGGETALFVDDLSPGTHQITLEVTDSDGDTGQDSIQVTVGEVEEPSPGDLVFSELMINPSVVADEVGEWVELYNTAGYPIDVGGYTFHDLDFDSYEIEGPLIVAGGDYLVLCASMDTSINGGVPCDGPFKRESSDALALGNGDDEVYLSRPDGVVIDELHYNETWFESGIAIGLSPEYLESGDNDDRSRWCNQTTVISSGGEPGTPGRENDPC